MSKGTVRFPESAKTKVAAAQYPFRFLAIQRAGRHGWRVEDLTSRSW